MEREIYFPQIKQTLSADEVIAVDIMGWIGKNAVVKITLKSKAYDILFQDGYFDELNQLLRKIKN